MNPMGVLIAEPVVLTACLALALIGAISVLAFALRRLRRAEKRLVILDTELRHASELVKKASPSRSELLTELGHEIRNPLSGIVGLTHAIEETPLTTPQRKFITEIRRCVTLLEVQVGKTLADPLGGGLPVGAKANGSGDPGIRNATTAGFAGPLASEASRSVAVTRPSSLLPVAAPRCAQENASAGERERLVKAVNKSGAPARRALVVEDIDYNAIATQAMLRAIGLESEIASDGLTALERVQSGHYDLVLMDWNLPGLTGTEVVKRLRASETPGRRHLIIGTSAYTTEAHRQACRDAGMDAFISKPLSPEKIAATLCEIPGWNEIACLPAEAPTAPEAGATGQLDLKLMLFLSDRSSGGLAAQIDRYVHAVDLDREGAHAAVAARDGRRIHQQAHRLLAHADAVKCEPLAELAAQLQSEAATTEQHRLQRLLAQIDQAFADLRNKLDSIRASTGPA